MKVVIIENDIKKVVFESDDVVKVFQTQAEYVKKAKELEKQWNNPKKKNPQVRITYVGYEN